MAEKRVPDLTVKTKVDNKEAIQETRRTVAKLAAEYRKLGMDLSSAMKRAWAEVKVQQEKAQGKTPTPQKAPSQPDKKKPAETSEQESDKALKGTENKVSGLKKTIGTIGGALKKAFSWDNIQQFGQQCVDLGSEMTAARGLVESAFGEMTYKMDAFASSAITQFGMSTAAAHTTGSSYMAMASKMGVAQGVASDMGVQLTGLSGDMASYFSMDQQAAAEALNGIFTGQTAVLSQLGVTMSQANLQQFAMSQGMNQNVASMSQAEQVALRYQYVTNALGAASGDFARTQNSWAGQTRILTMQWQEFMGVIGQALSTVLTPVVSLINIIIGALLQMANTFNAVISAIFGGTTKQIAGAGAAAANANKTLGTSAGAAAQGQSDLADATKKAAKEANNITLGIDELNIVEQDEPDNAASGPLSGGMQSSAVGESGGFVEFEETLPAAFIKIKEMLAELNMLFSPSILAWGDAFESLKGPVNDAFGVVKDAATDLWENSLVPLGSYILTDFIPNLTNGFSETFAPIFSDGLSTAVGEWALNFQLACQIVGDLINTFILPLLEFFKGVFLDVFAGISAAWNQYGAPILAAWQELMANIRTVLTELYYGVIKPVLDEVMVQLTWLWEEHLKPLWDNLMLFFGAFAEMALALWNERIYPMIQNFVTIFGPQIAGAVQFIVSSFSTAVAIISDVINGVIQIMRGLCDFLTSVFTGNWKKAWEGIKEIFGGVWTAIEGVFKGVVNRIIDAINFMIRAIARAINCVVDAINKVSFDLPDWEIFGDMAGKSIGFNLPHMPEYQIPKLARGAVLPANRPFLTMVGDQTRGTNVEAPLDTIKQAVAEVLAQMSGTQHFTADVPIELSLDGGVLYKAMARVQASQGVGIGGAFAHAY